MNQNLDSPYKPQPICLFDLILYSPVIFYPLFWNGSIGILGQVWYLIVSIPDLCTLTYFHVLNQY